MGYPGGNGSNPERDNHPNAQVAPRATRAWLFSLGCRPCLVTYGYALWPMVMIKHDPNIIGNPCRVSAVECARVGGGHGSGDELGQRLFAEKGNRCVSKIRQGGTAPSLSGYAVTVRTFRKVEVLSGACQSGCGDPDKRKQHRAQAYRLSPQDPK